MFLKLYYFFKLVITSKYKRILLRNSKNILLRKPNTYLFVICPPYCGSTLLTEILFSSSNVSCNNNLGTCEGQLLPGVKEIVWEKRWTENYKWPLSRIKKIWGLYWDMSKPVLLEKSPSHILRAEELQQYFSPSFFIVMVRNPYAFAHSLIKRNKQSAKSAAEFVIRCFAHQKRNTNRLNNYLFITYEELTTQPIRTIQKIEHEMPLLNDLIVNKEFKAHNPLNKSSEIINFNDKKFADLSNQELADINDIFTPNKEVIMFFGYKLHKLF